MKINVIAVVDDREENLAAASKAIAEALPGTIIRTYSSACEFIAAFRGMEMRPDLVLSDMAMEDKAAGHRVMQESWSWGIPGVIVSGGHKTHTTDQVVVGYPHAKIFGEKDDPAVWKGILKVVLGGNSSENGILTALEIGPRKDPDPDREFGEVCARVCCLGVAL